MNYDSYRLLIMVMIKCGQAVSCLQTTKQRTEQRSGVRQKKTLNLSKKQPINMYDC